MKTLLAVLMISFLFSCELVVDVDVPSKPKKVTVNSFFNPDSLWTVRLNLNRYILDDEPFQDINDAQVVIYDSDHPIDTLTNIGSGRFQSDTEKPESGKTYAVKASVPGYDDLRSLSYIPFPSIMTSVEIYEANQNSMLRIKFTDDAVEENFYELFVYNEFESYDRDTEQIVSRAHRMALTSEDPALQNNNNSPSTGIVFKDVLFNGKEVDLRFKLSAGGLSNNRQGITVTLRTLSEEGYNYLKTVRLNETNSGDPFAQPINVYNNIENGFGIFAGYSASVYTNGKLKPVITSIDPPSGKPGDHIIIKGKNFIASPEDRIRISFQSQQHLVIGQIVEITPERIEVIVPDAAVTGKIVVDNGRLALSDSNFIVTH